MEAAGLVYMYIAGMVTGALGFYYLPKTWRLSEEFRRVLCGPCRIKIIEMEERINK